MNIKILHVIGLSLLVLVLSLPSTGWAANTYYGLFVGIDTYLNPANDLSSCVNDAVGFRNSLVSGGPWELSDTTLLIDEEATEQAIKDKLAYYAGQMTYGDVFVYFHSGHGGQVSGTSTYLFPHDQSDFYDTELATALNVFPEGTDVIVVVDACHSGGLIDGEYAAKPLSKSVVLTQSESSSTWSFAANVLSHVETLQKTNPSTGVLSKSDTKTDVEPEPLEIAFITAAAYDESSYTGDPYSLFCNYLFEGFEEADGYIDLGDSSGTTNGQITFLELFNYASPLATVAAASYAVMIPQYYNEDLLGRTIASVELSEPAGDPYEDDDDFDEASEIDDGEEQWHSILLVGDNDYFTFTLESRSEVTVYTGGTLGDTRITLYNAGHEQLAIDDDGGEEAFSSITQTLNGGTYFVKVQKLGGNDTIEAYSINITMELAPPAAPGNLEAAVGVISEQVELSWDFVNGATSYNVYYDDDATAPYNPSVIASLDPPPLNTPNLSYIFSGLTDNEIWYFVVTAIGENGESLYSEQISAVPHPGYTVSPPVPFTVSAAGADGSVTVSWHLIGNARSYNVYCSSKPGPSTPVNVDASGTLHTFTGLTNNAIYYLAVCAVNETGESSYCDEVSAIPLAPVVAATGDDGGGGCSLGNVGSLGSSNFLGFIPLILLAVFCLRKNWRPGFISS